MGLAVQFYVPNTEHISGNYEVQVYGDTTLHHLQV